MTGQVSELYKVTDEDGRSFHGGRGKWTKARWRSVRGELVACQTGLHLCRRQDLVSWLGPNIWRAEVDGELLVAEDKVVARRARVVERLDTWNERTARLFAADCAERVLPLFEKHRPGDDRPRLAIEAARNIARGEIGDAAARAAARDAARDAARAAARAAAAWYAARAAARAAAGAAAWDAARAAAGDAAWAAAWAAAWDAAGAAAWDAAAWYAAGDAAGAAAWAWQTDRLFDYLEGRAA